VIADCIAEETRGARGRDRNCRALGVPRCFLNDGRRMALFLVLASSLFALLLCPGSRRFMPLASDPQPHALRC
jgi:hypothetical protein